MQLELGDRVEISGYAIKRYGAFWRVCVRDSNYVYVDMDEHGLTRMRAKRVKKVPSTLYPSCFKHEHKV
jgi:hypothetical protein